MKKFRHDISILSILSLTFIFCNAQSWKALNPPLNIFNNTIYATAVDAAGNIKVNSGYTLTILK